MSRKSVCFTVVWGLLCLVSTAGVLGEQGKVLFEYWNGLGGTLDNLYSSNRWPNQPDLSEYRTSLEGETGRGDTYSTRVRGFLHPPQAGTYFFWIASDDGSELWLSKDENPDNARRIASVSGWTDSRQWTKFPSQQSGAHHLEANKRYYIEARHAEGGGGDNLAVAWAGPGIGADPVVIAGAYLSPWPRMKPISPTPANGALEVKPADRILRWSPGKDHAAGYFDVYLGTDPANLLLVADNKPYASKLHAHAAGFEPGQIYYWRVDAVETDKTTVHAGDLWSFSVLPMVANTPDPPDGAKNKLTDVELKWRAGAEGDFHHVYFGADRDAVATADKSSPEYRGRTVGATTTFDPGELKRNTTYYWRVDEAKATGTERKGTVWKFSTLGLLPILDPDLVGWWKLDEGSGDTALDWSGHENHGEILYLDGGLGDNGAVWVDEEGLGTVLTFNGNDQTGAVVKAGKIPALSATDSFTWAFWAKQKGDGTGAFETIIGNRDVGVSYPHFIMFTPTKFQYFVNTGEYVIDQSVVKGIDYPDLQDGLWTHHAVVKKGSELIYYRDGIVTGQAVASGNQGPNAFCIGGDLAGGRWSGSIYNVRIYKRALSVQELESAMRRDPAVAWDPAPAHRRIVDIQGTARLTWKPGDNAIKHDVYLGTDAEAVGRATPNTPGLYRGRQSGTDYGPDDLQMGQTYYWRVDEIHSDQSIAEGYLWAFTVADFLIVDDFEAYNDEENKDTRIYETWLDGWGDDKNGSQVGHTDSPFAEPTIVHTGRQSMPYYYDTSGKISEATRQLVDPRDWTAQGVTKLSLWFRGDSAANWPERMYVALNGTAKVYHDYSDVTQITEWTEWVIPLQAFSDKGVDLKDVNTMTIGFGTANSPTPGGQGLMYFDDVRLYPDAYVGSN